jgi:LysR family transcriptional regulator, transcription activator of glutamate synthase operon
MMDMSDLAAEEWKVHGDEHPVVEVLQRSASAAGFTPRITFRADDNQEDQTLVRVGLGIALTPRSAVANTHPGVSIVSLGSKAPYRRVLLAHGPGRVRAGAEVGVQAALLEAAKDTTRHSMGLAFPGHRRVTSTWLLLAVKEPTRPEGKS